MPADADRPHASSGMKPAKKWLVGLEAFTSVMLPDRDSRMSQIRQRIIQDRDMAEHHRPSDHCPPCPACAEKMQLTRVVPRGNYVWEQVVFQCHRCEIALTQAGVGQSGCSVGEAGAGRFPGR